MVERTTFVLIFGIGCAVGLLILLYYYVSRKMQGFEKNSDSLMNHVLYQQKVLEKHDQILSQTMGIRPSMPIGQDIGMPIRPAVEAPIPPISSARTAEPVETAVFEQGPVSPLGPVVGNLLNMISQFQGSMSQGTVSLSPDGFDEDEDDETTEIIDPDCQVSKTVTLKDEDLLNEITDELKELEPKKPSSVQEPRGLPAEHSMKKKVVTATVTPTVQIST